MQEVKNVIKYQTNTFDLNNDDTLWEHFMCFVRLFIPYEEKLKLLSPSQKCTVMAFIYESEVMSEGHIGFLELWRKNIKINDLLNYFDNLNLPDKYKDILKSLPKEYISDDEIYDNCANEDDFDFMLQKKDKIYEIIDKRFYEYGNKEIEDKIINYIRENNYEFFKYI